MLQIKRNTFCYLHERRSGVKRSPIFYYVLKLRKRGCRNLENNTRYVTDEIE